MSAEDKLIITTYNSYFGKSHPLKEVPKGVELLAIYHNLCMCSHSVVLGTVQDLVYNKLAKALDDVA